MGEISVSVRRKRAPNHYQYSSKNMLMKKILFLFIPLLLCTCAAMGQQFSIEKSAEFDEPEYGWNKLLQLKNGNTFYFHSTKKEGIQVTVYDIKRKKIAQRTLVSRIWDVENMKNSVIKGLYEINGEPVVFVMQDDDAIPTLYRMRLNGTNGTLVKEEAVGTLEKPIKQFALEHSQLSGEQYPSDITVEKDPESDNYAIIYYNTYSVMYFRRDVDRSKRIKVIHYDGTHKKISEAFYDSPGGKFKYLDYIACAVDGSKRVYVTTYGHSDRKEDESPQIIVSVLNAGDTVFHHKLLDFSEDFKNTRALMRYNRSTNKIQLLTITLSSSKTKAISGTETRYYLSLITYIDPETLAPVNIKQMTASKVAEYAAKNIDKDYSFVGLPQDMILNKDNTTTLLLEEVRHIESGHISYDQLDAAAVLELSDTGAELQGYAINKKQRASGGFSMLYLSRRSKGIFAYNRGWKVNDDEFLSYSYINAPKGHYVLFNDIPGNADRDEEDPKRKQVYGVSATNTICYKLNGDKIERSYLFGEPDSKRSATFSYIQSSDYNKEINTYATLIVEKDGRDKSARIAWVKFE